MSRSELCLRALGLALLYSSAFYLSRVGIGAAYWLPEVTQQVLYPTIVALLVLTPFAVLWIPNILRPAPKSATFIPLAILTLIAFLGIFAASGYSALDMATIAVGNHASVDLTRWIRVLMITAALAIISFVLFLFRGKANQLVQMLALLGYVYAFLAMIRLCAYPAVAFQIQRPAPAVASLPTHVSPEVERRHREVVWIIFDELDFNETLGASPPPVPVLAELGSWGISATNAYSPAEDTEASLPALLTGNRLTGVVENARGDLLLRTVDGQVRPFSERDSIFGRLPQGPQSAALLGFYHPYCWLFPSVRPCMAQPYDNAGRWYDALLFFGQDAMAASRWLPGSATYVPASAFRALHPMFRISEQTIAAFPQFLALEDKSLVFLHVNLPHSPGDYSQRVFHYRTVANDRENYQRNLRLVDQLTALAIAKLRERSRFADILLIISSDHWHRINSPGEKQRIPWIAWRVGESAHVDVNFPINTVHTQELVLDFLNGKVDNQVDIANWWLGKEFSMPLMPGKNRYRF